MLLFEQYKYNKSFAALAKESKFTFNLYRGRVDWTKLETLDVDRLVRDQDVELLNIHMSCVTNCNLESEYDLKIFDPNFIKLFKLAQLLIDFLLHCKQYLEHCIQVAHESLQAKNKEVEMLRKKLQASKKKVKQLKENHSKIKLQRLHHPNISGTAFVCSLCGKVFLNNDYLQSHLTRRHSLAHTDSQQNKQKNIETQISSQSKRTSSEEDVRANKAEGVSNVRKLYQEEIEEFKNVIFAEIKKLKESEKPKIEAGLGDITGRKFCDSVQFTSECEKNSKNNIQINNEVSSNPKPTTSQTQISEAKDDTDKNSLLKSKEIEREWQGRLEEREGVWRARLSAIDQQHKQQVNQLQEKLTSSILQGQEMKKDLESRLEEANKRIEKSEVLMEVKGKAVEESSNKLVTETDYSIKSTSPLSIESVETIDDKPTGNPSRALNSQQSLPFMRRKAFISEQSKTIKEDTHELLPQTIHINNLDIKVRPEEKSDIENTVVSQNSSKKEIDYTSKHHNQSIYVQSKLNEYGKGNVGVNETIVNNVRQLSNTEKGKITIINDNKTKIMDKESSISDTLSETESESSFSMKQIDDKSKLTTTNFESDDMLINTETQLTKQSLQCMEELLAANPKIMDQLRADLKQLLNCRLQGLGVDPDWAGVPPATFNHKMDLLAHQRRITAKCHKIYFTLRDKLNHDADALVHSHPTKSTTDSLLDRLRKKTAQVISASKFSRQLGIAKTKAKQCDTIPLAASSPKLLPIIQQEESAEPPASHANMITKPQSVEYNDSLSLSSSTYDEEEEEDVEEEEKPESKPIYQTGSVKSVLRNAMSTGNIAKKKVFFADQELNEKRSMSENSVEMMSPAPVNVSVANLVQDIQRQLSLRKERPGHSINVGGPLMTTEGSNLPLSQILPLTKSGRELLESEHLTTITPAPKPIIKPEGMVAQTLQPFSHIVKKVPVERPALSDLTVPKDVRQPLRLSPAPSLTSISSSLLDVSTSHSPRGFNWDFQDLEDNFKD